MVPKEYGQRIPVLPGMTKPSQTLSTKGQNKMRKVIKKFNYFGVLVVMLLSQSGIANAGIVNPGEYIGGDAAYVFHADWEPGDPTSLSQNA